MSARHTLRIEGPRALLYDRARHQYRMLSSAETFLLVATREIGRHAARGILAGRLGDDVAFHAEATLAAQEVFHDDAFDGDVVELPAQEGAYAAPLVVHLGVTLACNFSCAHCYSSSGKRAKNELSKDEIFALVDACAAAGVMKLVLGGGEPFVRRDLAAIVAHANDVGVDCYVHTNGSLLDEETLLQLSKSPPTALSVSLDGADADVNDRVRGPGAFQKAEAGLALLRAHYPPGFHVSFTVSPENQASAPDVVTFAKRAGAKLLLLRPAYPAGVALENPALQCDRDTFAQTIDAARARAVVENMELDAPHPHEQAEPDFDGFGCVAGRVVLGVSPTGDVTPCLNLDGSFVSGNLRTRSLLDLWRDGESFVRLRDNEPNAQCDSCRHYDTCRGGCRVRALHDDNGLNGPDSWCHYEPREGETPTAFVKPASSSASSARARLPVIV